MMKKILYLFVLIFLFNCEKQNSADKVLFSSSRNGSSDIFMMNLNGNEIKSIVSTPQEEWGATFMDANNITFMRQIKDSVFRFRFNLETKKEEKIPHLPGCYLDDKNVVYSKNGDDAFSCQLGIFVRKKSESNFKAMNLGNRNKPNYLAWSFDGKSILYTDDLTGSNDVYAINVDTQNITNLTNSDANDERGDLSPDGNFLVFSSNRHDKNDQDLFILNLKTQEIENITNSNGYDLIGRWSSDGKSILFGSNKDGNWEIYRYLLKDKSTIRLTNNDSFDGDPRVR